MRGERFSTQDEIKDFLHPLSNGHGGLVAFEEDGTKYVEDSEYHQLVLGSTGVGKTWFMIMSQVRAIIESCRNGIIIDAKSSEIYRNTAFYAAKLGYDIRVVDFRHFRGQRYNPLAYPKALYDAGEEGRAQEQVQEIVLNLVQNTGRNLDTFWINAERCLLGGCINLLMETAAAEDCTFTNVTSLINEDWSSLEMEGRETVDKGSLSEIVDALPFESAAKSQLLNYVGTKAMVTKSCIMSETLATLAKFSTTRESVAMTSKDDLDIFNLDAPVGKPFMLYIILPDDSDVYNDIAGILMSQLTNRLVRLADSKYNGKLPVQVNMILEELGNVGAAISGLPFLLTASRSRNIKMTLSLQALYQLNSLYGDSKAATILSCVDTFVCFRTADINTVCEFARRCGTKIVQSGDIRFAQPLLSEQQLMSLKTGQALILLGGGRVKYVETFKFYKELFDCSDLEEMPMPKIEEHRRTRPIKFFDLQKNMAEKERKKKLPKRQMSPFKQIFDQFYGGECDD